MFVPPIFQALPFHVTRHAFPTPAVSITSIHQTTLPVSARPSVANASAPALLPAVGSSATVNAKITSMRTRRRDSDGTGGRRQRSTTRSHGCPDNIRSPSLDVSHRRSSLQYVDIAGLARRETVADEESWPSPNARSIIRSIGGISENPYTVQRCEGGPSLLSRSEQIAASAFSTWARLRNEIQSSADTGLPVTLSPIDSVNDEKCTIGALDAIVRRSSTATHRTAAGLAAH